MVKISQLLNSSILNSEWLNFMGDSEYVDENGELQFGYWSFLGIVEETNGEVPFDLKDELPEEAIYGNYLVPIRNKKDHICVVEFHYRGDKNADKIN